MLSISTPTMSSSARSRSFCPYKSATFRGVFGHAFRLVACACLRTYLDSLFCIYCVYSYVFESSFLDESQIMSG